MIFFERKQIFSPSSNFLPISDSSENAAYKKVCFLFHFIFYFTFLFSVVVVVGGVAFVLMVFVIVVDADAIAGDVNVVEAVVAADIAVVVVAVVVAAGAVLVVVFVMLLCKYLQVATTLVHVVSAFEDGDLIYFRCNCCNFCCCRYDISRCCSSHHRCKL